MSETVNSSLKKAAKGSTFVLASMAFSQLLWFFIKILVVRDITKVEFGIYSLVLTVLGVISAVILLGIPSGLSRFVSLHLGEEKREEAYYTARAGMQMLLPLGLLCFAAVYLFSGLIARKVFYTPELAVPLKVISFLIPFSVAGGVAGGVMLGFGVIRQRVFSDVFTPVLYLVLLLVAIFLGLHLKGILYAFVASSAATSVLVVVYGVQKLGARPFMPKAGRRHMKLLKFSIPLLASTIMSLALMWSDTLMLGRYSTPAVVGTYSVSVSLVRLLLFPLSALGYVFLPIAGEIYAKKKSQELKRTYQVLTKWVFAATLPLFFVFFFFPEMTITVLFGSRFVDAAMSLRILAIGFMINAFLGTNGMLLTVIGLTKTIMNISITGAIINVVLNYVLIKYLGMGITGAALATMSSYIIINLLYSLSLIRYNSMHPFTSAYLRPLVGAALTGVLIYVLAQSIPLQSWMLPVYFLLFIGGYAASLLITRSIEREDIFIFREVMAKVGIEGAGAVAFLSKFVS
ncbi:MAG: flippase [Candidatus Sulfobium sp.]|jgi:O-antigen/teichoic acid export membrane protein